MRGADFGGYANTHLRVTCGGGWIQLPHSARFFLFGNFSSGLSGLGEADCDGLLAAGDFFSGSATFQGAMFAFVHGSFDFAGGFFAVFRHGAPLPLVL